MKRPWALVLALVMIVGLVPGSRPHARQSADPAEPGRVELKPTAHPRLPADVSQFWLAPSSSERRGALRTPAMAGFVEAVRLEVESNFAKALPMFSEPTMQRGTLGDYAAYYQGLAELRLGRPAVARHTFQALA